MVDDHGPKGAPLAAAGTDAQPAGPGDTAPGDRPLLQVSGVSMSYPETTRGTASGTTVTVLEDFDLDVPAGSFVTLVGPSGCGKTTLLKIIAGLTPPTTGAVYLENQLSLHPSADKAMVFQHFNLFPWRTALASAAYGLELQGVPKRERLRKAAGYLRLLGLEGYEDYYPSQMSGGMKQRVGIARALAIEPKLVLMDEPFGSLDALTREYLQGELEKICREQQVTVLFVTHSIDEAIYLSDQIVVMGTRPGRMLKTFRVGLPRPRRNYELREEAEYVQLRGEIWSLLETQLRAADPASSRPRTR